MLVALLLATVLPLQIKEPPDDTLRVFWRDGLRFESADRQVQARLGAQIQLEDGVAARRVRFRSSVTFAERLEARLDLAFEGSAVKLLNADLTFRELGALGKLRVGHFREPMGLDDNTSSSGLVFLERGLPSALSPGRNLGVMVFDRYGDTVYAALDVFREAGDSPARGLADADAAVTARVAVVPWPASETNFCTSALRQACATRRRACCATAATRRAGSRRASSTPAPRPRGARCSPARKSPISTARGRCRPSGCAARAAAPARRTSRSKASRCRPRASSPARAATTTPKRPVSAAFRPSRRARPAGGAWEVALRWSQLGLDGVGSTLIGQVRLALDL